MRFHRGVGSQQLLTHERLFFAIPFFQEPFLLILSAPIPLALHPVSKQILPPPAQSFPPADHSLPLAKPPQLLVSLRSQQPQQPAVFLQLLP